jgi:hypothetical protein
MHHAKPARPSLRRRARLEVEALEERTVMSTFSVVAGPGNSMTTFGTLHDLLNSGNVQSGDVIQIEPGSNPGHIAGSDFPALVKNLTIQGDPTADLSSIPYFFLDTPVFIGAAQQGLTFKHVQFDLTNGALQFTADGTITDCHVKEDFAGYAVVLQGTTAAVISDSYFESSNPQTKNDSLLTVVAAPNSHNSITDNQFVAVTGTNITLLTYTGTSGDSDVIAHNIFNGNTDSPQLAVQNGTQGLTIQGNTFTDGHQGGDAITIEPPVQHVQIVDNVVSFPNGDGTGILVDTGSGGASTSMVIADNHFNTGSNGGGIVFRGEAPGLTLNAKVEGNDFRNCFQGILMQTGAGGSVAGIDLGGGALGSVGGNDFRGDHFAIYVFPLKAEGPVQAQMNIFGVDPATVIHDNHNDPTLAAVVSTNALTGNAAYVQTLYVDFLHRAGDVNSQSDAGHWVTLLNQATPAATVANQILRSAEALGVAVDGLYHRFLGRDADPAGRAGFVGYLQAGGTLEGVRQTMLASPEYQSHFQADADFVQSLYQNLLQRTPGTSEVDAYLAFLPQVGRAGVAAGFLSSAEFRGDEVMNDYTLLLGRAPSTAEVNGWVGTNLDLLTIDTFFAASQEFQTNG